MSHKHLLNICGLSIIVWGPEDMEDAYKCFIKHVAEKLRLDSKGTHQLMFALQLTPIYPLRHAREAYIAYQQIHSWLQSTRSHLTVHPGYVHTYPEIFLKCDTFLQSSPPCWDLEYITPPKLKQASTALDKLTEILVEKRKLQSDGTTSVSWSTMLIRKARAILTRLRHVSFTPQPQTLLFLLVIMGAFGFLVLPIR